MVSIDASVFIQIVNFIFLIFILNAILYKPIRKVLIQRKENIAGLEQSIDAADRDAKEKDDAFMAGIQDARAQGLKEKELLLREASEEEKRILQKINKEAQAELEAIRKQIAKDTETVGKSLHKELDVFANQISQKILGRAF